MIFRIDKIKEKIINYIIYGLSIPKSLYYNIKCFPLFIALKLPVFISYRTKVIGMKRGSILIKEQVKPCMFKFGFGGSIGVPSSGRSSLIIKDDSRIILMGTTRWGEGSTIRVENSAELILGNNVRGTKNIEIYCSESIVFGDDVLIGWNVVFRDSDGHTIINIESGEKNKDKKNIKIGSHVWIAANTDILKGSTIPNGCVVGYRSCVLKAFETENVLIAGYPAKILKENIKWE